MKFSVILAATFAAVALAAPAPSASEKLKLKVRGAEYLDVIERSISNLEKVKRMAENGFDPDEDQDQGICSKVKRDIDSLFE